VTKEVDQLKRSLDRLQLQIDQIHKVLGMKPPTGCYSTVLRGIEDTLPPIYHRITHLETSLNAAIDKIPDSASLMDSCVQFTRRVNNLVLYNISESNSLSGAFRHKHDLSETGEVLSVIGGQRKIARCHRIGLPKPGKTRPLLLGLGNGADRDYILANAYKLKGTARSHVRIAADRPRPEAQRLPRMPDIGIQPFKCPVVKITKIAPRDETKTDKIKKTSKNSVRPQGTQNSLGRGLGISAVSSQTRPVLGTSGSNCCLSLPPSSPISSRLRNRGAPLISGMGNSTYPAT